MDNYFDLYQIPVQFQPDKALIRKKFLELSRVHHPDLAPIDDEAAKAEALRMSAINNQAYKTLNNEDATMSYLLRLENVLEEEEKYNLPQDFLMDMMDLNEVVSDYEMTPDESNKKAATDALQKELETWNTKTIPLLKSYDIGEKDEKLLMTIKDFYFRKKYLLRIQERLNTFASR